MGIEPTQPAWKAGILPLNYTRIGDPYENRTRVTAVKGPCLNLLTNGPSFEGYTGETPKHLSGLVAATGFEPVTLRV